MKLFITILQLICGLIVIGIVLDHGDELRSRRERAQDRAHILTQLVGVDDQARIVEHAVSGLHTASLPAQQTKGERCALSF